MATRPDLSGLMQVDPYGASALLGQQQALYGNYSNAETNQINQLITNLQQENEQKKAMAPLLQQHQQLVNQGLQTDMPGKAADAQVKQLNAQYENAILPQKVTGYGYDVENKGIKNDEERQKQIDKALYDATAIAKSNIPGIQKRVAVTEALTRGGLDPNNPNHAKVFQFVQQLPENSMGDALEALRKYKTENAPDYQKKKMEMDAQERIHAGNNAATITAAQIAASARVQAAQARASNKALSLMDAVNAGKIKLNELPDALSTLAAQTDDPDEKASLLDRARKAEKLIMNKATAQKQGGIDTPAVTGLPAAPQPSAGYGAEPEPAPQPQAQPQVKPGGQAGSYQVGDVVVGKGGKKYRYVGGPQNSPSSYKEVP